MFSRSIFEEPFGILFLAGKDFLYCLLVDLPWKHLLAEVLNLSDA